MAQGRGGSVALAILTLLARAVAAIAIGLVFGLMFLTAPHAAPPADVQSDSELGDQSRRQCRADRAHERRYFGVPGRDDVSGDL